MSRAQLKFRWVVAGLALALLVCCGRDKQGECPDLSGQQCPEGTSWGDFICDDCEQLYDCSVDGTLYWNVYPCSCVQEDGSLRDIAACNDED